MRIELDLGAAVVGPPWVCSCGVELDPSAVDGHLTAHLRDRLQEIDPHLCEPPTLRHWARWRWARLRAWLRR